MRIGRPPMSSHIYQMRLLLLLDRPEEKIRHVLSQHGRRADRTNNLFYPLVGVDMTNRRHEYLAVFQARRRDGFQLRRRWSIVQNERDFLHWARACRLN